LAISQSALHHHSIFAPTGVGGTLAGAVLAVLQQKQLLAHSLGTAASCMICVGGFAGVLHDINSLPFSQTSGNLYLCHDSLSRNQQVAEM